MTDLLYFCFNTTQSFDNDTYYQQVFGMGTGFPAVVGNLGIRDVKQGALASSLIHHLFWKRYVDHVVRAVSANEVERLLSHFNLVEPFIQFSFERENERCLPFFD